MKAALIVVDVQQFYRQAAPEDLPRKIADEIENGAYDAVASLSPP